MKSSKTNKLSCPVCSSEAKFIFASTDKNHQDSNQEFSLYQCDNCEAVFQYPMLDEAELTKFYPDNYGPHHKQKKYKSKWKSFLKKKRDSLYTKKYSLYFFLSPFKDPMLQILFRYLDSKTIDHLDVGCGRGEFLAEIKKHFNIDKSVGIDINKGAVQITKQKKDIQAHQTVLRNFALDQKFDLISANHVLEHIPTPHQFVEEIKLRLKENGLLLLSLPNVGGWGRRLFGTNWVGFEVPRHVLNYSKESVKMLIESHDFEILEVKTTNFYLDSLKPLFGFEREQFKQPLIEWPRIVLQSLIGSIVEGDNLIVLARRKKVR